MEALRSLFMPIQGSTVAADVDALYMFIFWLSVVFYIGIAGVLLYSAYKFPRKSKNDVTPHITHHFGLEMTWSIVPLILCLVIFFWGFHDYMVAQVPPGEAIEVQVTAKKWLWQFEYTNGTRTINELHVPANRPVKLIMASEDVIHSFYVPSFRLKQDVLPNRYTELWFEATQIGTHAIACTEYCGKGHSEMYAKLVVDEESKYQEWLETGGEDPKNPRPLDELGAMLYESQGCNTCHSLDGSRGQGPSWKGIYGQDHRMTNGQSFKVDENYIRTSILEPQKMIVQGFEGIMPSYQGALRERQILALIAFVKKQK